MEAPVPASALIHSATLVSAGLYLLLRFSILVNLSQIQNIIFFIGSITALYGGIVSASQTDMKKLLAYSTISHCGFLFLSISLENYFITIAYLFLHGLFKAMTFFCAGSFIRVFNSQDTRNMGNGFRILPCDTVFLMLCALNLGGMPFSFGYLYKSLVLITILNTNQPLIFLSIALLALLTGIIYTYRLVYYSAFDVNKEFSNTIILELQQKKINVVKHFSFTSLVQISAISIMFFFTIYIYLVFKNIFLSHNFLFNQFPITVEFDTFLFCYTSINLIVYYEFFYTLYFILIFLIYLII